MNRVHQIYQAILEADNQGTEEIPIQQPRRRPPAAVQLEREVGDDEVLAEAALSWVREKKREMALAKLVALRGQEWVNQQIEKLQHE